MYPDTQLGKVRLQTSELDTPLAARMHIVVVKMLMRLVPTALARFLPLPPTLPCQANPLANT